MSRKVVRLIQYRVGGFCKRACNLVVGVRPAPDLKRPVNNVDHSLMQRIAEQRQELDERGVEVRAVLKPGPDGAA